MSAGGARPPAWRRAPVWLKVLVALLAVVLLVAVALVRTHRMPSGSMFPAIAVGEHVLSTAPFGEVERGDVIVFPYPADPTKDFLKRVVAIGGDTIELRDNVLWLGGKAVPRRLLGTVERSDCDDAGGGCIRKTLEVWEETLGGRTYVIHQEAGLPLQQYEPREVPPGMLFVLGDSRDSSADSRTWGFVPKKSVASRVRWVFSLARGPRAVR